MASPIKPKLTFLQRFIRVLVFIHRGYVWDAPPEYGGEVVIHVRVDSEEAEAAIKRMIDSARDLREALPR